MDSTMIKIIALFSFHRTRPVSLPLIAPVQPVYAPPHHGHLILSH